MSIAVPLGGPPAEPGAVYLVGGGPGDPGLLSLRGARLLSTATLVAHDRLSPPEALGLCTHDCERVYVGKLPDRHALAQDDINALLVRRARQGDAVVRLKGGDPFVLGRGSEEAQACVAAGIPFEVVPGVTSATAVPAYAGIPVTHRGLAPGFAVVTGHEDPTKDDAQVDCAALAAFPGTLVLLMGVGRIGEIAAGLVAAGKDPSTPVALVRWGSTPRQETLETTLAGVGEAVARSRFGPPAVTVVGDVAGLRAELGWFDRRALHGRCVLVPRARAQASALSERLRALGAHALEAPAIVIAPAADPLALRGALERVVQGSYDWVGFTSPNAVDAVWREIDARGGDARRLARVLVAAVGPGTQDALARRGVRPDLLPEASTATGLGAALAERQAPGSILLPRGDLATPVLPAALRDAGWNVDEVQAYRTARPAGLDPDVRQRLRTGALDAVAFASSSTVRNLVELLGALPHPGIRIVSIGPVTSRTCTELGLRVHAEADPHDLDGLVAAVRRVLS